MVWNRAVFLPPHCSPFCSVWWSSRPQRTSTTLIAYTSVFMLMGACSTWGVCKPTQRTWNYRSGSCCVLTMPSSLLTQRQLCSESRPVFQKLLRSLALKSAWRRRKFCISSHHKKHFHRINRTEGCPPLQLLVVRDLVWRQDWQRSW